ncbi:hypothetical protein KIN20_029698 [Parelaphostrongylus tenuis]|uniref:Uncharacterized protein n=1 Tax=Parelaphostrongylus tenuis TaxID=148309 RepID=A0AAD5R2U2_PARTN|nr:hypothetical protein KIN20_029698 [Parelaphostrongylus tenuis]
MMCPMSLRAIFIHVPLIPAPAGFPAIPSARCPPNLKIFAPSLNFTPYPPFDVGFTKKRPKFISKLEKNEINILVEAVMAAAICSSSLHCTDEEWKDSALGIN